MHTCPTRHREFNSIIDYPRIHILSFERLPTPEAVDDVSDSAAEKDLNRRRQSTEKIDHRRSGINMTPEIERACRATRVFEYFDKPASLTGRAVAPSELLPPFPVELVPTRPSHPKTGGSLRLLRMTVNWPT